MKFVFIAILSLFTLHLISTFFDEESSLPVTAEVLWADDISGAQKAVLCDSYWTQPKEEVVFVIEDVVDFTVDFNDVTNLYEVMNTEC